MKDKEREERERKEAEENDRAYKEYISEGKEKPNYPNFVRAANKEGFTFGGTQHGSGTASPQRGPLFDPLNSKRYRSVSPEI